MRNNSTARTTPAFFTRLGFVLALAATLAGCAKRETLVESGNRTQTLHLGNLSEPNDLDPQVSDSNQTSQIIKALFEGLAMYDAATCAPVPAVAERWESSADAKRWTFFLRQNARWSNGDPVTAHDFVYAFRRILSPGLAAEYAPMLYVLKNGEAFHRGTLKDATQIGAIAADDHTLVLELDAALAHLPKMVCHTPWFPVHRATIEKHGRMDQRGTAWTRPGNLVGNGYFVLDEWKPNQIIRCSKSPTYWDRDAVKLNAVNFYPIDSQDAEERAFRSGQLHVTADIPLSKIAVYKRDHPEQILSHVVLATYLYRFNVTQPPLNDSRVRRALALSIDRARIVSEVSRGGQLVASHFTPPDTDGFTARIDLPYDVTEARRLLAEAKVPADIVMRRPQWKPGDVIVVDYAPGQPYTYVRGAETWPVDKGRTPKTDADIDKLWDNGQVRPVLQSGGVPFAASRLP